MDDDKEPEPDDIIPANDNQDPGRGSNEPDQQTRRQVDQVVLTLARLIGRRIAREHFAEFSGANDNKHRNGDATGDDTNHE